MTFEELGLSANVLQAVRDCGYAAPTPIQEQAIPHVLAGRDVIGASQTGTGKTAAFALPILTMSWPISLPKLSAPTQPTPISLWDCCTAAWAMVNRQLPSKKV